VAKQAVKKLELWFTTQGIPISCTTTNLPWINSLERFLTVIILLHADPQVIYYYCVTFNPYQVHWSRSCTYEAFEQTGRQTVGWTDRWSRWFLYTPPKRCLQGYTKTELVNWYRKQSNLCIVLGLLRQIKQKLNSVWLTVRQRVIRQINRSQTVCDKQLDRELFDR